MSQLEETFALHLRAAKQTGWVREHKFHPTRRWRFDFYQPDLKLAVECEGGIFTGGRHTRAGGFLADAEKYNAAAEMGITVLRFASPMIKSGEAIAQVERIVKSLKQYQKEAA